ncbi:hypothetical protein TWF730_006706 [Orbilia blumenaviensis]|uniref:Yippee domain-containing protein n=1 Tax=Orbilia blumenaviensis TaxID=1796055 RepID=A0AAV9VF16_9PEZI
MTTSTINFPRFLLPAFPRWDSSLLKRHRPVEDVTETPVVTAVYGRRGSNILTDVSSSSDDDYYEEAHDVPVRHGRILSHDSGCIVSDDGDDEIEEERQVVEEGGESSDDGGRAYTYAPARRRISSSSADSLEIYLDTESGYGGSTDELTIPPLTAVSSSSGSHSHDQGNISPVAPRKRKFAFFPSKSRQKKNTPAPPKPTLSTTTTYLSCSSCRTNLCFSSSVISKGFTGRHGRAYLVTSLIPGNIIHGKPTSRSLQTGAHTVSDISCKVCGSILGWKYIHAEERGQKYKVGKYILETGRVDKVNYWDGRENDGLDEDGERRKGGKRAGWEPGWESLGEDDDVEVDLADEEELEEMFAGSWNKDKALRRRERRRATEEARRKVDSNV